MAVASENVAADVVEVGALAEMAERYRVRSVPKTLVDGAIELLGSQSESSLVEAITASAR
jgi:hypothetical protein